MTPAVNVGWRARTLPPSTTGPVTSAVTIVVTVVASSRPASSTMPPATSSPSRAASKRGGGRGAARPAPFGTRPIPACRARAPAPGSPDGRRRRCPGRRARPPPMWSAGPVRRAPPPPVSDMVADPEPRSASPSNHPTPSLVATSAPSPTRVAIALVPATSVYPSVASDPEQKHASRSGWSDNSTCRPAAASASRSADSTCGPTPAIAAAPAPTSSPPTSAVARASVTACAMAAAADSAPAAVGLPRPAAP